MESQNHVFNGVESGIFLSGNSNVVTDNVITEAAIGVLKETGSSGNIIARNRFFNTPVAVQDPQFIDAAKLISPKRCTSALASRDANPGARFLATVCTHHHDDFTCLVTAFTRTHFSFFAPNL